MDDFAAAIQAAGADAGCRGIGTLGEKSLHLALKYYFAPDSETHEQPVGGFVADAVTEDGVIEVQTRSLYRLRPKLRAFLPHCPVTVVYPVAAETQLCAVSATGELLGQRKSPKHESVWHAMPEIARLHEFLCSSGFRVCVVSLNLMQYYRQAGRSRREKLDRAPVSLNALWYLAGAEDYLALLPRDCPAELTASSFAEIAGIPRRCASAYLRILRKLSAAEASGRRGRELLIRIRPQTADAAG